MSELPISPSTGILTAEQSLRHQSLYDFAVNFFRTFGGSVTPREKDGSLWVDLPDGLSDHFGKPALHLVFQNSESTAQTDLVAYGSRVFDRMMAFLERRGGVSLLQLPRRHQGADQLLRALQPRNAAVSGLKLEEDLERLFVFNWHVTYRSDDKREELYTVVLDSQGNRAPLGDERADGPTRDKLLDELLADGEPLLPSQSDEGQSPNGASGPRLPPMTHLARLAESARKFALFHADLRCVALEAEILPRLHKVLSRLTSYYEQQIGEVYDSHDPQGEKRRGLEVDLQRKIDEEIENHRLRVQVRLFSYAILHVPVAAANISLNAGAQSVAVRVTRDLYSGQMQAPPCYGCGEPLSALVIDRAGHTLCDGCTRRCGGCQELLCERCGLHNCPVCQEELCETCSAYCWSCGQRACAQHSSHCPVCGDGVCHSCQESCAACGERQCRSHLRVDGVSGGLICQRCAVRCPNCQQDSSHLAPCSASGQRFCTACILTCAGCQRLIGPSFAAIDPGDGQPYCADCLTACGGCGELVGAGRQQCQVCQAECCGHCGQSCSHCDALLCQQDASACRGCGAILCPEHVAHCELGQEPLCPACDSVCPECGYSHCGEHAGTCSVCLQTYCAACVGDEGRCEMCRDFPSRYRPVAMPEEAVASDVRIANLMNRYRWIGHSNSRYTIYLGEGSWNSQVLVVAEGERVHHVRRGIFYRRLLGEE